MHPKERLSRRLSKPTYWKYIHTRAIEGESNEIETRKNSCSPPDLHVWTDHLSFVRVPSWKCGDCVEQFILEAIESMSSDRLLLSRRDQKRKRNIRRERRRSALYSEWLAGLAARGQGPSYYHDSLSPRRKTLLYVSAACAR